MKVLIITSKTGDTKGMYEIKKEHLKKIKETGAGLEIEATTDLDKKVTEKITKANILISTDLSLLTEQNIKNLKWVHITSAGANKIPDFLKDSKILITNSSGVHPIPISEHVFGLMLMLVRGIHKAHREQTREKKWKRSYQYYLPNELYAKQLLVVGMGRIGERIAQIGEAFGMKVSAVVRNLDKKRKSNTKLFLMKDLVKLVVEADFIVNCLPSTGQTKGLFNYKLFKKFKPLSYFINIGLGTTVVEDDLIKILEKGIIAGAGLDVFQVEPLPNHSKLWNLENVILTAHYSGWTPRYMDRVIDIFCQNLKGFLRGGKMPNLIDKKLGY